MWLVREENIYRDAHTYREQLVFPNSFPTHRRGIDFVRVYEIV